MESTDVWPGEPWPWCPTFGMAHKRHLCNEGNTWCPGRDECYTCSPLSHDEPFTHGANCPCLCHEPREVTVTTPDPSKFKKPHGYASFIPDRLPNFKTHSTLGLVKSSLTMMSRRGLPEAWVYKFDVENDEWVELAHVNEGDSKDTHALWEMRNEQRKPKAIQPISEDVIDETLASIQRSAQNLSEHSTPAPPPAKSEGVHTEDHCHCGAPRRDSDHCWLCGCEEYETYCELRYEDEEPEPPWDTLKEKRGLA